MPVGAKTRPSPAMFRVRASAGTAENARGHGCQRTAAGRTQSIPHQEFIQIDTTNILFICGGAFDGIEGIIQKRTGKQGMGFGSEVKGRKTEQTDRLLAKIEPHDLMKFGLIPS